MDHTFASALISAVLAAWKPFRAKQVRAPAAAARLVA